MNKSKIRILYNKYNYTTKYNRIKLKRPLYWSNANMDIFIDLSDIIKKIL